MLKIGDTNFINSMGADITLIDPFGCRYEVPNTKLNLSLECNRIPISNNATPSFGNFVLVKDSYQSTNEGMAVLAEIENNTVVLVPERIARAYRYDPSYRHGSRMPIICTPIHVPYLIPSCHEYYLNKFLVFE